MMTHRPLGNNTLTLVGIAFTACVLGGTAAFAQQPAPAGFPAPEQITVQDDENDGSGTKLTVQWGVPEGADAAEGYQLVGYRVHLVDHATGEMETIRTQRGAENTELSLGTLRPGKKYVIRVGAVYLPERRIWEIDAQDPDRVSTPGAVEALSAPSVPTAPVAKWFNEHKANILIASLLYCAIVLLTIYFARRGEMYIRPIPGLEAVNDAIGRATEMGRPILYISGLSGISDIATIASMLILGHLSKRTAAYETPIIVPCNDPLVLVAEREIVHQAYIEAGKPDAYKPENIFYVTDSQFGYAAAVDGIMMREKPAANFFMGMFYAESLILAETGNRTGAIQIAGTDADTQLPFFITACDYTLMGEELYAAGAYLSRNPLLVAQLKGQDFGKVLLAAALLIGATLVTLGAYLGPDLAEAFLSWFQI